MQTRTINPSHICFPFPFPRRKDNPINQKMHVFYFRIVIQMSVWTINQFYDGYSGRNAHLRWGQHTFPKDQVWSLGVHLDPDIPPGSQVKGEVPRAYFNSFGWFTNYGTSWNVTIWPVWYMPWEPRSWITITYSLWGWLWRPLESCSWSRRQQPGWFLAWAKEST